MGINLQLVSSKSNGSLTALASTDKMTYAQTPGMTWEDADTQKYESYVIDRIMMHLTASTPCDPSRMILRCRYRSLPFKVCENYSHAHICASEYGQPKVLHWTACSSLLDASTADCAHHVSVPVSPIFQK